MKSGSVTSVVGLIPLCLILLLVHAPKAVCDAGRSADDAGAAGRTSAPETILQDAWKSPGGTDACFQVCRLSDRRREVEVPSAARPRHCAGETVPAASSLQAKPDLTVLGTWTVPDTFCRYAVVDIHSTVKNIGTVAVTDSFYFDMWFDGENVGFARIEGLAAGETLEFVLDDYPWPGDTLSHIVTAMADTDHEIDEELETNNIDLEYFAADLCTTCTFVSLPFETGWNWFSLNVDDPDMSLDHVLASLDTNGVYIKNQTAFAEYVPAWNGWFGTLASLSCHETYMIKMMGPDTLDFCGFPYDVSTPLALPAGWSWISYLPRDTMSVDDALSSLEASGEYIKDQTSFSEYIPAWNGWFGTLVDMCPGEGYKIRMAEVNTLTYPDSTEIAGPALSGGFKADRPGSVPDIGAVNAHDFETNGCMIVGVRMDGKPCVGPGDRLGVFCRGEPRGMVLALAQPDGDHVFYLTVHGGEAAGEVLTFRYFEAATGMTYEAHETVEFRPDMTLGNSLYPFGIHVSPGPVLGGNDRQGMASLGNRPDPFTSSTSVRFRIDRPGVVKAGVYDVRGAEVVALCDGYLEAGTYSLAWDGRTDSGRQAPGGVYFCRLVGPGGLLTEKMILMR